MKLQAMMTKRKPNLYLFPATILCLHLMFAVAGFYLSAVFQVDLEAKTAQYQEARNRLPLIRMVASHYGSPSRPNFQVR